MIMMIMKDVFLFVSNQETAVVSVFNHHTKPVVSVEWNHNDSSVFASASEDNQVIKLLISLVFIIDIVFLLLDCPVGSIS